MQDRAGLNHAKPAQALIWIRDAEQRTHRQAPQIQRGLLFRSTRRVSMSAMRRLSNGTKTEGLVVLVHPR